MSLKVDDYYFSVNQQVPNWLLSYYFLIIVAGWERERILHGTDKLGLQVTMKDVKRIAEQHKGKKKRQHRKSHGLITFQELSRIIANRWRELPMAERQLFEDQAAVEKEERMVLVHEWEIKEKALRAQGNKDVSSEAVISQVVKQSQVSMTKDSAMHQQDKSLFTLAQSNEVLPSGVASSDAARHRSASSLDLTALFSAEFEEEIMSEISASDSNYASSSSDSAGSTTPNDDSWNFSVDALPENVLGDLFSDAPLSNVEIQEIWYRPEVKQAWKHLHFCIFFPSYITAIVNQHQPHYIFL